jgi:hypothetical protein
MTLRIHIVTVQLVSVVSQISYLRVYHVSGRGDGYLVI